LSRAVGPDLLLEWSPSAVLAYEPAERLSSTAPDIEQLTIAGGKAVLLALSRRMTFVKAIRVPDAAKEDVIQILRVSVGSHLPLPANEVAFDVHLTPDKSYDGRLASLLAVRSIDLKDALARVKASGHKVARVVPVAWGSVLIAEKLGLQDAVVVSNADGGYAIDLVHLGGLRYSRAIPHSVTDLEEEVRRTCAASEVPISTIVAAGGLLLPFAARSVDTTCLQALSDHPERLDINLELVEEVMARIGKDKAIRQRFAALTALLALVFLGGIAFEHSKQVEAVQQAAATWQKNHRGTLTQKSDLEDQVSGLIAENKILDQAMAPGQNLGDALLAAANEAPSGLWLTGLTAERGKPISLRGTAVSSDLVTQYVRTLEGDARFRNVKLVFANQGAINQAPVVEFSLQAMANGNIPVVDAPKVGGGS